MLTYLLQGLALGFAAGISPGPMLGLVINQSLTRGARAGGLVAIAPLMTDLPIIAVLVVLLAHVPPLALHALALAGGAYVIYLGVDTLRSVKATFAVTEGVPAGRVLLKAVTTNFLNPHPYLFWATVGAALLAQGFAAGGVPFVAAFLVGFYALLVGAKLVLAIVVSHSRAWLKGRGYTLLLVGSGVLLLALGVALLWEGISGLI